MLTQYSHSSLIYFIGRILIGMKLISVEWQFKEVTDNTLSVKMADSFQISDDESTQGIQFLHTHSCRWQPPL